MTKDADELDLGECCLEHGLYFCDCEDVHPGSGRLLKAKPIPQASRRPLPPAMLVDALHDRVHKDRGIGRAARTVRSIRERRKLEKDTDKP